MFEEQLREELYIPVLDIETVPLKLPYKVKIYREGNIKPRGNLKDPLKINHDLAEKKTKLYERDALDPYYCRIVAVGYTTETGNINAMTSKNEEDIIELIRSVAKLSNGRFLTFNGSAFDIPVIRTRCMLLGLPQIQFNNIRDFDVIRLIQMRDWFDRKEMKSLSMYANLLNVECDIKKMESDILSLWNTENMDEIKNHVSEDVRATKAIFDKIKHYVYIGEVA